MAVELRLGPPNQSVKDILIERRELLQEGSAYKENWSSIVEMMRTFVACYYVSSW
jgi:hypothetical protein